LNNLTLVTCKFTICHEKKKYLAVDGGGAEEIKFVAKILE